MNSRLVNKSRVVHVARPLLCLYFMQRLSTFSRNPLQIEMFSRLLFWRPVESGPGRKLQPRQAKKAAEDQARDSE